MFNYHCYGVLKSIFNGLWRFTCVSILKKGCKFFRNKVSVFFYTADDANLRI